MSTLSSTERTRYPDAQDYRNVKEYHPGTEPSNENKTLGETGIDADVPIEKLNSIKNRTHATVVEESKRLRGCNLDSLINYIVSNHHKPAKQKAVLIYNLADRASQEYGAKHPELLKLTTALFLFFDDLLFHLIREEEQILLSNILQLNKKTSSAELGTYTTFGLIKSSSISIHEEHEAIIKNLKSFRNLTNVIRFHLMPATCTTICSN